MSQSNHPGMSQGLTLLFSIAGGAAVGNLYWAQPLLSYIATSLGIPAASAGLLVTATQIGYAIGVFLVIPLGDVLNRRRLIPSIMFASSIALALCAVAPNYSVLLIALALVGLTTTSGQLLIPLAGDLAKDDQRGHIVGTIVSGLLTGILLSRTVSGLMADAFGWQSIYILASVCAVILAILLGRAIPHASQKPAKMPYGQLLLSVFKVVKQYKSVQVTLMLGALSFAVFTMFWTGLTFLLSAEPYFYTSTQIGMVGFVGLAGALAARRTGKLHDRGLSIPATGIALALALLSLLISEVGETSIIAQLVTVLLLDIAIQMVNVLNQIRLFSVDGNARSRLNTAFITCNFIGGALGSTLAGFLWQLDGWMAITLGEGFLIALALLVWFIHKKGALQVGTQK